MIDVRTRLLILLVALAVASGLAIWSRLQPAETTVSVYFIRTLDNQSTVEATARFVQTRGTVSLLHASIAALLEGPTPAEQLRGLATAIPKGTKLRSVQIRDDVVYLDLSGEVESGGGSSSMLGRLWQIVYTATQFPEASTVRILIDGQDRTAMGGEGLIIERPLERPTEPPKF